jgi:hypothetical protein
VGGGLVGDDVRTNAAHDEFGKDACGVGDQPDRQRLAGAAGVLGPRHRFFEIGADSVQLPQRQPALRPRPVDFEDQRHAFVHRDGQGLGSAHLTQSGRNDELPLQARPAVLARQ